MFVFDQTTSLFPARSFCTLYDDVLLIN
jgi:hypothetical protein